MNQRYQQSQRLLKRAEQTIPLGSQTFSKSQLVYPKNVSPLFLSKGDGCQVWDADGNKYIDFVNGLLSISLGYCNPSVDNAVLAQLKNGVSFSLPHQLEMEVSEEIVNLVPCAEMVRFGKNGSDATSAAIRLARAYTQREHIAVCGYHGWHDWYIGATTRDLGVPEATKQLTHLFEYNNIASLEQLFAQSPEQIAAVILEPMNVAYPEKGFLEAVKALCEKHNAVLIFDETITGFRFNLGGAQQLFNVSPDLATFGKGMANGYAISAIAGKKDIMMLMEDIFFSGTFAGETLSLAATQAVLQQLKNENALEHIHAMGEKLISGINNLITKHQADDFLSICGHPSWSFFVINPTQHYSAIQLKSLYIQEMCLRGILINSSHNLSFAHKIEHINTLLTAYDEIIQLLVEINQKQTFEQHFKGELLEPVFKVR